MHIHLLINPQIEFPSILLPPSISSGSIVDITVSRNLEKEQATQTAFEDLQSSIFATYGQQSPSQPVLRCRNATQTAVVLEWDAIDLATADLRSLSLYRNGAKAGSIPRPLEITSTKISGLAIDTEYNFQLVLRTSAGTYSSQKLDVRTHKMTDLSGITVTPGVLPTPLRQSLATAVERIGGRLVESVRIDTTHFVCTEGRGREWERAVEMNIPVVRPEWIEGCEREGRIVGVRGYYLNADPRLRQVGQGVNVRGSVVGGGHGGRTESMSNFPSRPTSQQMPPRPVEIERRPSDQPLPPQTHVEPPTPPAKDRQIEGPASTTSTAVSRDEEDSEDDDDEEEDAGQKAHVRSPQGSRNLVQGGFEAAGREQELAYRTGEGGTGDDVADQSGSRRPSEGGDFSEVQL